MIRGTYLIILVVLPYLGCNQSTIIPDTEKVAFISYEELYDRDSNLLVNIAYIEDQPSHLVHYSKNGKVVFIEFDSNVHINQHEIIDIDVGNYLCTKYCMGCHQLNVNLVGQSLTKIYSIRDSIDIFKAYKMESIHKVIQYQIDSSELVNIMMYAKNSSVVN